MRVIYRFDHLRENVSYICNEYIKIKRGTYILYSFKYGAAYEVIYRLNDNNIFEKYEEGWKRRGMEEY